MEHKRVIEAALFISSKPLDLNELAKVSGLSSLGHLKEVLKELQNEYASRGMEIINTPQGWEMQVKKDFLPKVAHLTPHADMSEGCKRTLALIVYKEPVKQSDIVNIQGNKAYAYIKDLIKKGLVRAERKGRTKILILTQEFERYFGEDKEKIKEQMELEKED